MPYLACPPCPTLPNLAQGSIQERCPMPYRAGQRIGVPHDRIHVVAQMGIDHPETTLGGRLSATHL